MSKNAPMQDASLIDGLLGKRTELLASNAELGERMAIVANDMRTRDAFASPAV